VQLVETSLVSQGFDLFEREVAAGVGEQVGTGPGRVGAIRLLQVRNTMPGCRRQRPRAVRGRLAADPCHERRLLYAEAGPEIGQRADLAGAAPAAVGHLVDSTQPWRSAPVRAGRRAGTYPTRIGSETRPDRQHPARLPLIGMTERWQPPVIDGAQREGAGL